MPALRLIEGRRRPMLLVSASDHDGLHAELTVATAERLTYASKVRTLTRAAMVHLSTGHTAAAGTSLVALERLTEQEATRAAASEAPCACSSAGPGHGGADSDALDVPREAAA